MPDIATCLLEQPVGANWRSKSFVYPSERQGCVITRVNSCFAQVNGCTFYDVIVVWGYVAYIRYLLCTKYFLVLLQI